jgi:hypothetical protein
MAEAYVEIPLHGRKAAGRVTLVDLDDYELASRHRWTVYERMAPNGTVSGPYAITNITRGGKHTTIYLHVLLTSWKKTDHQNHNGLDNRRSTNLRPATSQQNGANRLPDRRVTTSPYKGVSWCNKYQKWHAQVRVSYRTKHLGYFLDERKAAAAYNTAAVAAFGEYACLNEL